MCSIQRILGYLVAKGQQTILAWIIRLKGTYMDTVITKIIDTLSVQNISEGIPIETWSFILSIFSLAIALLALLFSVFWNWYAGWKKEITIQWIALAGGRIDLWRTLDASYKKWDGEKLNLNTLGKLLNCASIPKRLKRNLKMSKIDVLINDLRTGGKDDIKDCQTALFLFCDSLWNEEKLLNECEDCPLDRDTFSKYCSKLTWSLDGWAKMLYSRARWSPKFIFILPLIPRHYLRKRFASDWTLLTILTYLELALKDKIKERWSDRSGLFRLAYKVNKHRAV